LAGSAARFTQAAPQLDDPPGQAHAPFTHVCPTPHAVPQPPQLAASVVVSVQPAAQAARPFWHPHVPLTHALPTTQVAPQAPQCAASDVRFTHAPPHWVWPSGHPWSSSFVFDDAEHPSASRTNKP
jgi:hypothetical protein